MYLLTPDFTNFAAIKFSLFSPTLPRITSVSLEKKSLFNNKSELFRNCFVDSKKQSHIFWENRKSILVTFRLFLLVAF